jgi:hypothetical protein
MKLYKSLTFAVEKECSVCGGDLNDIYSIIRDIDNSYPPKDCMHPDVFLCIYCTTWIRNIITEEKKNCDEVITHHPDSEIFLR